MTDEIKKEPVSEPTEEEIKAPTEEELDDILAEAEETSKQGKPDKNEKEEKKKKRREEAELAELKQKLADAEAEIAAGNDKYLRLAAEYDNFRRRSAKEREGIYTDAYGDALTALFPVIDNLERAAQYTDGESVAKGVAMVLKSVGETLEKLGVTEVPTKTFDPNLHNAVMHIEDPAYGEGEIVEVLQKGYCRGDKVLRYAMVKVAN